MVLKFNPADRLCPFLAIFIITYAKVWMLIFFSIQLSLTTESKIWVSFKGNIKQMITTLNVPHWWKMSKGTCWVLRHKYLPCKLQVQNSSHKRLRREGHQDTKPCETSTPEHRTERHFCDEFVFCLYCQTRIKKWWRTMRELRNEKWLPIYMRNQSGMMDDPFKWDSPLGVTASQSVSSSLSANKYFQIF